MVADALAGLLAAAGVDPWIVPGDLEGGRGCGGTLHLAQLGD